MYALSMNKVECKPFNKKLMTFSNKIISKRKNWASKLKFFNTGYFERNTRMSQLVNNKICYHAEAATQIIQQTYSRSAFNLKNISSYPSKNLSTHWNELTKSKKENTKKV
jgi:hypothetical protein